MADSPRKVLVTGVYGLIGGAVYRYFASQADRYEAYGLARRREPSVRVAAGQAVDVPQDRFALADLSDYEAVRRAVAGMDTVVQLAATPGPDPNWSHILQGNISGPYHVFEACMEAGVRRIVFASSIMVSWGYRQDEPYRSIQEGRLEDVPEEIPLVTHLDPPRPTETYSASKVWGESLAQTYAGRHGMSCLCIRIGWVNAGDHPGSAAQGAFWCSQRDIVQLVRRCVEAPEALCFDVFYGVSESRYRWVDIAHAREAVGYVPADRAEDFL